MKKIDYKLKRLVTARDESFEWFKETHEIAKYDPTLYDDQGIYHRKEWEEFSDVGKVIGGHLITAEEYLSVEDRFVSTAIDVMKASGCKYMTVVFWGGKIKPGLDEFLRKNPLGDNDLELQKAVSHLRSGDKVSVDKTDAILRMALRKRIYFYLLNLTCQVQVNVGNYYYMFVHTPLPDDTLRQIVSSHDLFLDPRTRTFFVVEETPSVKPESICFTIDKRFQDRTDQWLCRFSQSEASQDSEYIDDLYGYIPRKQWISCAFDVFNFVEERCKKGNYAFRPVLCVNLHDVKRRNTWDGRNTITNDDIRENCMPPEIFLFKDSGQFAQWSEGSLPIALETPTFDGSVFYNQSYDVDLRNYVRMVWFCR